jgi:hypothetical protein
MGLEIWMYDQHLWSMAPPHVPAVVEGFAIGWQSR